MQVCRNVLLDPFLLPGGGAVEMAVSKRLTERSRALTGVEQWPYRAVAQALEVIPRTLIQNCGASTIRVLTSLRVGFNKTLFIISVNNGDFNYFFLCVFLSPFLCSGETHSGQQCVLGCGWRNWRFVRHVVHGNLGAACR